jgi:hypothetical protein
LPGREGALIFLPPEAPCKSGPCSPASREENDFRGLEKSLFHGIAGHVLIEKRLR